MAQTDPGPRAGAAGAGAAIAGLTVKETKFFDSGVDSFTEIASVTGRIPETEGGQRTNAAKQDILNFLRSL